MPCYRTPAQMRTITLEDKENASPQLAQTPETSLPAKTTNPMAAKPTASPLGAKSRFGYTTSPPGQRESVAARVQQAAAKPQPTNEPIAAPSAKTLLKELASEAESGGDTGRAPTAKQLLVELQHQNTDASAAENRAAEDGGECGAFTVSWTPVKAVKKPVLAAKKPAEKKSTFPKAPVREPAVPARRSLEKVGIPGKAKPFKDEAGSAAEKKAVGIKSAISKAVDKKTAEAKKAAPPAAAAKPARASIAVPVRVAADKGKMSAVNKRKTFSNADKWAEDENTITNQQDGSKLSVHERLQQIRAEHCCSLGEARRILWKETWGTSASPQKQAVCVQPARPADPVAHQFVHDEVIEDDSQDMLMAMLMDQRPRSAPNTPSASFAKGQEVLARAKSSDNLHDKQGAEDFEAIDSPSKFPVFAATPGKGYRRHSLLYSPAFAKTRQGMGQITPSSMIKRATGGTVPVRVSPLAELDTSQTLGHVRTPTPNRVREFTASPIRVDGESESFQSASESPSRLPSGSPSISGNSRSSNVMAEMRTSDMAAPTKVSPPASQSSGGKEVRLHTDIMTRVIEKVVEKVVTVEVPGPERIVEVERLVIKEVPVYVDRVVESDRVVATVKEVPVDRIVMTEKPVLVEKVIEVEKIVQVEPEGLREELAAYKKELENLEQMREDRMALELERDQLEKQYQDTCEQVAAQNSQVTSLQQELAVIQEEHQRMVVEADNATKALNDKTHELATLVSSSAAAQLQARTFEEQMNASEAVTKDLEEKLAAAEEAEAALKRQLEDAYAAVRNMEMRCREADEALSERAQEKSALEERYNKCLKQLAEAEETLKVEVETKLELEKRYNGTINDFQEQLLRAAELESEVGALRNAKLALEGQVQAMKEELDVRSDEAFRLYQQLDDATAASAEGAAAKEGLQLKLSAAEDQLQAVSEKMAALEEQVFALTAQLDDVTGQLDTMKSDKTAAELRGEELDAAYKLLQNSDELKAALIFDLNAEVSGIEEKLTEATRQIRMLTEEKEEVVAMLNAQYSAQAELQEQMAAARAKEAVSRASAAADHEELQSKVTEIEKALANTEAAEAAAKEVAAAAKEAQRTRVAEAEEARSRAMEQVEFLKAELKAAQEQALEAEAKNDDVSGAVEEAYEEVRTLTAALQEREACVQDIEQRLAAAEAAHDKVQIELRDAQAVAAQATAESNATRTASLDLAAEVQDKVALISKLEDQLKKQGAEIIYQEVVKEVEVPVVKEVEVEVIKEVEVEKIVTQIEYREVEVIKEVEVEVEKIVPQIEYREVEVIKEVEVEVEKIVTQIEYRDVIKEVEVEKIVPQIEYREVEVIKEVEVEVEKIVPQIEYREVEVIKEVEVEVEKIVTQIEYRDVIKEVEVEKIVPQIEYREVEVIKEVEVEVEKIVPQIEYRDVLKEVEVEKIVTQIEYREVEVIKEVEVEKIVTQIEYREVEVIKEVEVEVEKIVTQIEYRDVIKEVEVEVTQIEYRDVIKEVEVEKIVTQIEYREVEVIKEVEVEVMREVFKSPIKAAERVSANDKKPKKAALHSAAPLPATSPTAPATSGGSIRTVASACAVAAVCASAFLLGVPLHNMAHGTCPRASAPGALMQGGAGASAHASASAESKALEAASQKLLSLEGEVKRRNAQLSDALESKSKALAGKLSAEQQAAAMKQEADVMQQTKASLEERLQLETEKAAAAAKRVETLKAEKAEAEAKHAEAQQQLDDLQRAVEKRGLFELLPQGKKVQAIKALHQFGAYARSLF